MARVPAKPKPGEGWSRASRSQRWIGFSEDDANTRRRRRYPAAKPGSFAQRVEDNTRFTSQKNLKKVLPCKRELLKTA